MILISGSICSGVKTICFFLNKKFKSKLINGNDYNKDELLKFLTDNWYKNYCVFNLKGVEWEIFKKRPFICFIFVDATIDIRSERFKLKFQKEYQYKKDVFHGSEEYYKLISISHLQILNNFKTKQKLYSFILELNIFNDNIIRPNWDTYFIKICQLASKRSNCMKQQVGCIIVNNNRIISTGYNGTPQGIENCRDGGCKRCNCGDSSGENLDFCLCLHAEENAIMEAGKTRILKDSVLYCTLFPCVGCSKKIVQMNISKVIYITDYNIKLKDICIKLFKDSNIICEKYIFF
jgi:dCMP deaminase